MSLLNDFVHYHTNNVIFITTRFQTLDETGIVDLSEVADKSTQVNFSKKFEIFIYLFLMKHIQYCKKRKLSKMGTNTMPEIIWKIKVSGIYSSNSNLYLRQNIMGKSPRKHEVLQSPDECSMSGQLQCQYISTNVRLCLHLKMQDCMRLVHSYTKYGYMQANTKDMHN